jgi:hypothetical protein
MHQDERQRADDEQQRDGEQDSSHKIHCGHHLTAEKRPCRENYSLENTTKILLIVILVLV